MDKKKETEKSAANTTPVLTETLTESEKPTQLDKLKRWLAILRQVCQENPQVVLRILEEPRNLILQSPNDAMAARAEKLRWTVIDQEKARREFSKKGVDPEKALGVINFLRNNVIDTYYTRNKDWTLNFDQPIRSNYQYEPVTDSVLIGEIAKASDDPVALLKNLSNVVNFDSLFSLEDLASYSKLVASNPRANEIINKIKLIKNFDKLEIGYNLYVCEEEDGNINAYFGGRHEQGIADPLQILERLDEKTYQELMTEANLVKAQELWTNLVGDKKLKIEFLPGLLKLANNPQLEIAFRHILSVNEEYPFNKNVFTRLFLNSYDGPKFNRAVRKVENIYQSIPEAIELIKDGFDLKRYFQVIYYSHMAYSESIIDLMGDKEEILTIYNNQELRAKARIMKKYGLAMPLGDDSIISRDFLAISNPDRLEKALEIQKVAGNFFQGITANTAYEKVFSVYKIMKEIGDKLSNFSVKEISDVLQILVDEKNELNPPYLTYSRIFDNLDSIDTFKKRIQYLIDPEINKIIADSRFNEELSICQDDSNFKGWSAFFLNPEVYLALYKQKELFYQRITILNDKHLFVFGDQELILSVLQLSEEEFANLIEEFLQEKSQLEVNQENVAKFKLLKDVDNKTQEDLLVLLDSSGIILDSIYASRLGSHSVAKYFQLSDEERVKAFEFVAKYSEILNLLVYPYVNSKLGKIHLDFICDIIKNDEQLEILKKYLNRWQNLTDKPSYFDYDERNSYNYSDPERIFHGKILAYFRNIIDAHSNEDNFNIEEFIDSDGLVTDKFLSELMGKIIFTKDNYDLITYLITDEALAKMNEADRNFWQYCKNQKKDELLYFLISQKTNFAKYVKDGIASADLINDFFDLDLIRTEARIAVAGLMLTEEKQVLERMDDNNRQFWSFWLNQSYQVQFFLIHNKKDFSQFVINGKASPQFISTLAFEKPVTLLADADLSDIDHFSLSERSEIRKKLILGLIRTKNFVNYFDTIYVHLSKELRDNGEINSELKTLFKQEVEIELTEKFIKKIDRFRQESQDSRYSALITDFLSYWRSNGILLVKIEKIGWVINKFDKFRSMVQNGEINNILLSTEVGVLINLSRVLNLNPENIYYVNRNSIEWLKNNLNFPERIDFLRKILNEKPSSFNSCIAAFNTMQTEAVNQIIVNPLYSERLLEAMEEFGNITPSLIDSFILNPSDTARAEYREKINGFRRDVHRNVAIKTLAEGQGGLDFLVDMIAMTFPGTNVRQIKADLEQVQDRCADVNNLMIREHGYQGEIVSREKTASLRDPNNVIDEGVINLIKVIFADQQNSEYLAKGGDEKLAFQAWARLLVEAGATDQKALFADNLAEVIACSRVSLGDKLAIFAEKMTGDTSQLAEKNDILGQARELFGIYYKDNAPAAIEEFLQSHQEQVNTLLAKINNKKLDSLEKNIVNSKVISEKNRADFKEIISSFRQQDNSVEQKTKLLARLLAFMTERSIFSGATGLRKAVSRESEKIVLRDKEGQEIDPNLIITGYITKNAASFFAKNTANVCTAGNIELFNRSDHFHVNLVNEEGIVVGNIQGYQVMRNGQPALIFRGFNPSTSIISSTNAEILCDQMLDMVKQIAEDNNITQVYIPQQDNWHPLSNRVGEGVDQYFARKFYRQENVENFSFGITASKIVDTFYKIV